MSDSRNILRAYGAEVVPRLPPGTAAHELGQALSQQMKNEPPDMLHLLRKFFQRSSSDYSKTRDRAAEIIRQEAAVLAERFYDFWQAFPENERVNLAEFVPTIEGVIDEVTKVHSKYQAKRCEGVTGRIKKSFHRFCETINAHKSLLSVLPEGNEYISIFTGALHVVIQASETHEKVAEGLGESLSTIGECIEDIQIDIELFPTESITHLVSEFYGQVFVFLSGIMEWIMAKKRRRLLKSFNDDLIATFEKDLDRIVKRAGRIQRRAAQSSRAEAQFTRRKIESLDLLAEDMRLGSMGVERQLADRKYVEEKLQLHEARIEAYRREDLIRQERLGLSLKLLLKEHLRSERSQPPLSDIPERLLGSSPRRLSMTLQSPIAMKLTDDIELHSACLEDHFCRDRVRILLDSDQPLPFEAEVMQTLKDWSQGAVSSFLWLAGPTAEGMDSNNPITLLASRVIDTIDGNRLNVVSYFCDMRHTDGRVSREARSLVALLYAIIRQLIELLPPRFNSKKDLSPERFSTLRGTLDSWDAGLSVMEDILELVPGTAAFCVIDGLDVLDYRSIQEPLSLLLKRLRSSGPKLRVLFTTSGRSYCLGQEIRAEENIVIDNYRDGLATYALAL